MNSFHFLRMANPENLTHKINILSGKFPNMCITQSILKQSKLQRQSTITEKTDFGHFSTENSQINNHPNQHFGRNIVDFWHFGRKFHNQQPQSTKSTFWTENSQIRALPKQDTFQLTELSSVGTGGVVENVGDRGMAARWKGKKGSELEREGGIVAREIGKRAYC